MEWLVVKCSNYVLLCFRSMISTCRRPFGYESMEWNAEPSNEPEFIRKRYSTVGYSVQCGKSLFILSWLLRHRRFARGSWMPGEFIMTLSIFCLVWLDLLLTERFFVIFDGVGGGGKVGSRYSEKTLFAYRWPEMLYRHVWSIEVICMHICVCMVICRLPESRFLLLDRFYLGKPVH